MSSTAETTSTGGGGSGVDVNIKEAVKQYFTLDKEIKEAGGLLKQIRQKRKERETDILQWLRAQGKTRIKTKYGCVERSVKSQKVSVNKDRVREIAESFLNNPENAEQLCTLIYEERPFRESEVLKAVKDVQSPTETAEL